MRPQRTAIALCLLAATAACSPRSDGPKPAGPATALVRISYGSEKRAFLTDSLEAFHRTAPRTRSGKAIRVEAIAEGSAESMESILAGRSDIVVWSPASSLLVDVLNDRWAEKRGLGGNRKLIESAPSLVLSPVVIAVWEPMARALGWPEKPIGWKEVAEFSSGGWQRFGQPQWGAFKFGHTHPHYSNSGAIALVAETYAGAGKTRELEAEDVDKAAAFVRRVQSNVVHYGRSTGFFADTMFTRGPGYLSAAVVYENLVVESALDPKYKAKAFPVVAVYPKEGTFWSDHPYAILDLPSTTAEEREGAERFRDFLLGAERQKAAMERFGFRPADPQLALGAPLDAQHGVDPRQPQSVLPNPPVAVTRRILETFEHVKRPASVTFVIDTSGSMQGMALQQAKAGAAVFLGGVPDSDTARVLFFSAAPRWLSQTPEPLKDARPRLVSAIDAAIADGGTALYDAIAEACRPAPGDPRGAVRAVVVLSDGQDTDSRTKLEPLLALLRRGMDGEGGGARVFTIAYGEKADAAVLKRIAEAGGGAFFAGTPKDIKAVYAELATFF